MRAALAPLVADPAATAVVTDFDGTLAPIVDDPSAARPLTGAVDLLWRLAAVFGVVAVVSGRPASFLRERLAPPGRGEKGVPAPVLVGLYGLERVGPDGEVVPDPDVAPWVAVVQGAADRLSVGAPEGVLVEPKGAAVTLHWRRAPSAETWVLARVAEEAASTGLVAHPGRRSLELRPPLAVDKGSVVRRLAEGRRAACYFGDDLGDLPAFAALAELGTSGPVATVAVAVVDAETPPEVAAAATVAVRGPEEALRALAWLADPDRSTG